MLTERGLPQILPSWVSVKILPPPQGGRGGRLTIREQRDGHVVHSAWRHKVDVGFLSVLAGGAGWWFGR